MTYPSDDESFVTFVKTYQPSVPPASSNLENRLMAKVKQYNNPKLHKISVLALGIVTITGLGLTGLFGQRMQLSPQVTVSHEEIESFLVQGWEETVGDESELSSSSYPAENWSLLSESSETSVNP